MARRRLRWGTSGRGWSSEPETETREHSRGDTEAPGRGTTAPFGARRRLLALVVALDLGFALVAVLDLDLAFVAALDLDLVLVAVLDLDLALVAALDGGIPANRSAF